MSYKNESCAAIVFTEPNNVAVIEQALPSIKKGTILVKSVKSLISTGTELTILKGNYTNDSAWGKYGKFPFYPGYNNIGIVVDVADDVDKNWIGKKVASYSPHMSYVLLNPSQVRVINQEISDEEAAFFTISEIVMNGIRRGKVTWGECIVVYGLGLLGQLVVRLCHFLGARPVIGVDVSDYRLNLLPKTQGIIGVNPNKENLTSFLSKNTNGRMADVVFEVTGNPKIIPQEFSVLKDQGRFVVLSSPSGATVNFDFHDLCNSPSFTIIGAHNNSHPQYETPYNPWTQKRHAELFFNLISSGELDLTSLISYRVSYLKAPEIYRKLQKNRINTMGIIIEW
ncbi:zinc-binding alcohol dehydrogenase [Candidatus Bathyarchaeota archaeon]|nr:zinc-binding alcohol dehydrogenase [Candidatus Bathyarchaeota archaeon]